MAGTEVSTAELLLANLNDHQVVRVEGSDSWCQQLYQRLQQLQDLAIVKLEGDLNFPETKMRVTAAITDGHPLVLLWLDPDSADPEVFPYLFLLARDAEFAGKVVLLIKNSNLMSRLLSELDPAVAYADGYYQEEIRSVPHSSSGVPALLPGGILIIACALGGIYWYQSGSDSGVDQGSGISSGMTSNGKDKTVYAWSKPVTVPENTLAEPVTEEFSKPEANKKQIIDMPPSVAQVQDEVKATVIEQEQMLSDFNAVLKKDPNPEAAAPVSSVIKPIAQDQVVIQETADSTVTLLDRPTEETGINKDAPVKNAESDSLPNTPESVLDVQIEIVERKKAEDIVEAPSTHQPQPVLSSETPVGINPLITTYTLKKGQGVIAKEEQVSVIKTVDRWARAWAAQDWDNYIGSYIDGKPYGIKVSLAEWREFRKDRLVSPEWVKLKFGHPSMTVYDPHWVKVELYQRFEKPGYADETTKRLELKKTLNGWRIASEATDGTVVLSR